MYIKNKTKINEINYQLRLTNAITKNLNKFLNRIKQTRRKMDYVFTVHDIISVCNKKIKFQEKKREHLVKKLEELTKLNNIELFENTYIYNTGELYEHNKR